MNPERSARSAQLQRIENGVVSAVTRLDGVEGRLKKIDAALTEGAREAARQAERLAVLEERARSFASWRAWLGVLFSALVSGVAGAFAKGILG